MTLITRNNMELTAIQIASRPVGRPRGLYLGCNPRNPIPIEVSKANFWRLVKKANDNECWEMQIKPDSKNGYCRLCWGGKRDWAHRFSWIIHNGEIPNGLCVLHKCDNRVCVNPNHLWLGTKGDNNRDMFNKGRGSPPPVRSILLPEQVIKIRKMYDGGRMRQCDIARELGLKRKQIESALFKWKNIPGQYNYGRH